MNDPLSYLFYLIFVFLIIEFILNSTWNSWYFRQGIPIYRKNYTLPKDMTILAQRIQSKWIPDGWKLNLTFKDIAENEVAFREEIKFFVIGFQYAPVMHGLIRRNSKPNGVEIVGYLNWSAIVFAVFFLAITLSTGLLTQTGICGFVFLIFFAIVFYTLFRIQAQRFDYVGTIFDEEKE